jgi:hypothetical protein
LSSGCENGPCICRNVSVLGKFSIGWLNDELKLKYWRFGNLLKLVGSRSGPTQFLSEFAVVYLQNRNSFICTYVTCLEKQKR